MNIRPKYYLYRGLFVLLGIMVSALLHAAIEIPLLEILTNGYKTPLELVIPNWSAWHKIASVLLFSIGVFVGLQQGRRWWYILYAPD